MSGYDFRTLFGQADHSAGIMYDAGVRDLVVEKAVWGFTKDGTKGQWTVTFRVSTGPNAGMRPLTHNISVSPVKNDGSPNPFGLGRMYKELMAIGIPVPDPEDHTYQQEGRPQRIKNGTQAFWDLGWTEEQVAMAMAGRPCQGRIYQDTWAESDGGDGRTRNKIADLAEPRPGAPTTWPQPQQPQQGAPQGFQQPYPQQGFAQPGGFQQPYPQQAPGGFQPPAQPPQQPWQGQPQQPAQPQYQPPQQPQYQPPQAAPPQGQPPIQGAPPWAQPGQPGQGGTGEFTQQGQSFQPSHMQPQQPPQGYPQQPPQAQPQQPPWQQQGPPQGQPQQGYPQQPPQQGQPPQGQPPQQDPNRPPWAQ